MNNNTPRAAMLPTIEKYANPDMRDIAYLSDEQVKEEYQGVINRFHWVVKTGKDCDGAEARFFVERFYDLHHAEAYANDSNKDSDGVIATVVDAFGLKDYCFDHNKDWEQFAAMEISYWQPLRNGKPFTKSVFTIDDVNHFEGYAQDGLMWNGWQVPFFTEAMAREVLQWLFVTNRDIRGWVADEDRFELLYYNEPAVQIMPIDAPMGKLYDLSLGLCWDIAKVDEIESEQRLDDFKDKVRTAVLNALDGVSPSGSGWVDADLTDLFKPLDAHSKRLFERIEAAIDNSKADQEPVYEVSFMYRDGSNYKFDHTIELPESKAKCLSEGQDVDVETLGITDWADNPEWRGGFAWCGDDHNLVEITGVKLKGGQI